MKLRSTPDPEREAELGSGTAEVLSLHLCGVMTCRDLSLLVVTQPLVATTRDIVLATCSLQHLKGQAVTWKGYNLTCEVQLHDHLAQSSRNVRLTTL